MCSVGEDRSEVVSRCTAAMHVLMSGVRSHAA